MSSACLPFSSLTRPERCSTVTPGKLATFWWRPVSRLKSVDFPELGGPTTAMTAGAGPLIGNVAVAVLPHSWQSLMGTSVVLGRPPFRGAARIPSHPPDIREGRRPAPNAPPQLALRGGIRAPSVATPGLRADRVDPAHRARRGGARK